MSIRDELQHDEDVEHYVLRAQRAEQKTRQAQYETRSTAKSLELAETQVRELEAELTSFHSPIHEVPEWMFESSSTPHRATLFSIASDWHVGEVIDPAQMDGVNAFNYEIAKARSERYFEKLVELPKRYMAGRKYEGIVLDLGGDGVSGSIHDELRETDEFSVLVACRKYRDLVVPGIKYLSEHYENVYVTATPGNHGRDSRKPRYKGRAEHNADTHSAYLIADACRMMGLKNVSFDIAEGLEVNFKIYDVNFRVEHGDEARGGNGVMGILAPLPRLVLRRSQQARSELRLKESFVQSFDGLADKYPEDKTPDIIAVGHWHQLVDCRGQGFLVNGCLKGFDEYARGSGFKPERPQQGLWVVTPERGLTTFETVHCDNRKEEQW